jgi:hypothetical protein
MFYLKRFGLFWYHFIIGDEWFGAAVILAGFIGTYALHKGDLTGYWLLPGAVILSVSLGLWRSSA